VLFGAVVTCVADCVEEDLLILLVLARLVGVIDTVETVVCTGGAIFVVDDVALLVTMGWTVVVLLLTVGWTVVEEAGIVVRLLVEVEESGGAAAAALAPADDDRPQA